MEKPNDHSSDYVLSSHDQLFSFDRSPSPLVRANKRLFFLFCFKSRHYFLEFSSASNCVNMRVIVKSLLVAGEGKACMSSPHSVRSHCGLLIF